MYLEAAHDRQCAALFPPPLVPLCIHAEKPEFHSGAQMPIHSCPRKGLSPSNIRCTSFLGLLP